jgi:hypothetical protein
MLCLWQTVTFAQSSDKFEQLEREIQDIRARLLRLESGQGSAKPNSPDRSAVSGEGWKSISQWRQLKRGMTPGETKGILGEPSRIQVEGFTFWFYPNGGRVSLYNDRLDGWTEPR